MTSRSLGQEMCRKAAIFQGITALPIMLYQGENAWEAIVWYSYINIYHFITAACTGLMGAAILFIILVERHPRNTKTSTYYLEIAKSGLATALWLWLLLDSIFGPRYTYNPPRPRSRKIIEAVICFFVLPILFYPTLVFARYDRNHEEAEEDVETQRAEREPLLGRQ